jgi:phosphatidylinositol alpha-mannosyltransferase
MFAALRSDVPVVGTFHAYAERSRLLDTAAPLLRRVWRRLSARVAVSNAAAEFVRARFGDGVTVVPNGLDVDSFRTAVPADLPGGPRILWVGRLDRQKGFPVALRAFQLLCDGFPDLVLVVAGDGDERNAIFDLDLEQRERVVMLGTVAHDDLPRYHAAADVFVAPALGQESWGYVLVEAMAAGLPVVASAIPGYTEVVRDGVEGLLVPPSDPRALADALREILSDQGLADRLGEAGRRRAEEFSWDRVVGELESIYRTVAP